MEYIGTHRAVETDDILDLLMDEDDLSMALDGCPAEPDGECEHGSPSWAISLGLI